MNFTRNQIIIIASVFFFILLAIGILTGILPGSRRFQARPPDVSLTVWGVDDRELLSSGITSYESLRPNVTVKYEEVSPAGYEQKIVNALAAGTGPDIVMFHDTWLFKHFDKIVPVGEEQLNKKSFQEMFPVVAEQDFAPNDKIYALPLYIDTLALFYNQDIFDKEGIALPPKDWLDFQNLIPKLLEKNVSGGITRAAAAVGGSNNTVANASDVLMLLMLQAGARMTDDSLTQATFAQSVGNLLPGADALAFYTKFSDPRDIYYTWNENMEYSSDSFAKGNVAMMFDYSSAKNTIRPKNPFLSFKAASMPQPSGAEKSVNYPDYWGLAVTNNSENVDWAWDLILYLTANESAAEKYLLASNRPPAHRILIQKYTDHPDLGVFAEQALSARSWKQIDKEEIAGIFSQMIKAAVGGKIDFGVALNQAEREVTELIRTRR